MKFCSNDLVYDEYSNEDEKFFTSNFVDLSSNDPFYDIFGLESSEGNQRDKKELQE